jgi:hypothetical protein
MTPVSIKQLKVSIQQ